MPLNNTQINSLKAAITSYGFPAVYFDFATNTKIAAASMCEVEAEIHRKLTSANNTIVLHGLANVIYWGYAQIGYRDVRVKKFIDGVSKEQIEEFKNLVFGGVVPTLRQIKEIQMPQFSGISFISKVLAFLDPVHYCVLDQQLARISTDSGSRALNNLTKGQQIRVTTKNQIAYYSWCNECADISYAYFGGAYRVIDVERGFFNLVQKGELTLAQEIYASA